MTGEASPAIAKGSVGALPHVPILRRGEVYESLERVRLADHRRGEPLVEVSQANAGLIRRDLRNAAAGDALRRIPSPRLLEICAEAGRLFMDAPLPMGVGGHEQTPESFVTALSATSGLPRTLCRASMQKMCTVLTGMPTILKGLTRGLDLGVLDGGIVEQGGVLIRYLPVANALGVVLPSNSPTVNSIWMPAVALKVPVMLKPGREDPWTPMRLIQALVAAGCPREVLGFYPTDHEGSATLLEACDRGLVFGDEATTAPYAHDPSVQIHGPGRSKIVIGDDQVDRWRDVLDVLVASVADNGGRSCINVSTILVSRHADAIAEALAERLAGVGPRPDDDEQAVLAAFPNSSFAERIDAVIGRGLTAADGAEDVTARHREGERMATFEGGTYLRPTVLRCPSLDHPLGNTEFLFPFVSVVEMPEAEMIDRMGPTLVVTAITRERALIDALVRSSAVGRLNIGPVPTCRVDWTQPHEGNLFEFLYARGAIQREGAW